MINRSLKFNFTFLINTNYCTIRNISLVKLILSVVLISLFTPNLNAQGIHKFENIELPNEFIGTPINCILEDSKGFIWLGFSNGLVLFDGYEGKSISFEPINGNSYNIASISSLVEDALGKIWIGTSNGVIVYNPVNGDSKLITDSYLTNAVCRNLSKTTNGELLIGTEKGLYIYNVDGTFLEGYSHQPEVNSSLSNNIVRSTYEDKQGNIWIGTFNKLNLLNRENKKVLHFKLQKRDSLYHNNNLILSINSLDEDNDDTLLIGTETGLCLFNTKTHQFSQFKHDVETNSISNNVIKSICKVDNQIWLGTDLGLNNFNLKEKTFQNYYHDFNKTYTIGNNVINDLHFDKHRNLWIATNTGLDKVYINSNRIFSNQFSRNSLFFKEGVVINNLTDQKGKDLWVATNQGVYWYEAKNNTIHNFLPPNILHNKVNDILIGEDGLVWIATPGGLNKFNPVKKTFSSYVVKTHKINGLTTNYINSIAQNSQGTIWLGTENQGIFKILEKDNDQMEFINFKHDPNNPNSISSNSIYDIEFDLNDNVWMATEKGVNRFSILTGVFQRFLDPSLYATVPKYEVTDIFVAKDASLWLSSSNGVYNWDHKTENFTHFLKNSKHIKSMVSIDSMLYYVAENRFYYCDKNFENTVRIPNDEFGLNSIVNIKKLGNRNLALYGNEGYAIINVDNLNFEESISKVKWTGLFINSSEVNPNITVNSKQIINQSLDNLDAIELDYSENSFGIAFSSFPFNSSKDIEYKYILEGYDVSWQDTKANQHHVAYTQVRPGNFTLKVKTSNKYGVFNTEPRTLKIKIHPPIYFSSWAFGGYVVLLLMLFFYYRNRLLKRERTKNELHKEFLNHKHGEELIQLKTRFFTNITHELKTPLTLISSPIDDLLTKQLDETTLKSLSLVKRNTDRLKKLVNQILDIRKIEAGGEKLIIQKYDIIKFCNQIKNQFKEEATKRNIFLQFSAEPESKQMWFDMEKVEKILFNLLSNAFKFTPNKGTIRVSIDSGNEAKQDDNYISITVSDTGRGISKEDQANIFDRFNSLSSHNYTNQKGTGIGLSLTYEYAALHNGTIKFESDVNMGSKFIFSLPTKKHLLKNYEIIETLSIENEAEEIVELEDEAFIDKKMEGEVRLKALIVEDDLDMREFLTAGLSTIYSIVEAEDGQEGFNNVLKELPDIIVSDLMMPNVDGLEFCKKIKTDIRTSHIPFILLTAKNGIDSKIIGIETGADAYIQKPFNLEHLTVRMKSLIKQRESLRRLYLQQVKLEPSEITVNSLDENFLDDLLAKIEMEIDNTELSVKLLSKMLDISPSNLYRKIRALTGQTATEFIRNIRLKRAAQLLKNEELNVSDVMYMVGFTHHSYFTKCFKELHGVSPKSYNK